ncbi:FkbM family methyltransferase [Mucilaginibacter corticis]|uniref:FkbM family methyltransferase n=1 Tax=Mucilaginibacter corticis TaxID=2597670 RepID=A0A556M7T5_9SPHI|nr:FkbM family methyltransferase [Mucilaginibacter corticis]TSJ35973.1 FkbM family methyltransferase [Mucilaginibacter corticis]
MNPLLLANKVWNKLFKTNLNLSFSQCGEDIILLFLINSLGLKGVKYLDIGTNDPREMNNTYLLYLKGHQGVCVEPDPAFHRKISRCRPKDMLIKAGVALTNQDNADFFLMDDPVLNTFSLAEAENMVDKHHRKIRKKISVQLVAINEILETHFTFETPLVISLDVEGLDFQILESIDYSRYRPGIICVETVEFSNNLSGKKDVAIAEFLNRRDYLLYADTHINSIFIDKYLLPKA